MRVEPPEEALHPKLGGDVAPSFDKSCLQVLASVCAELSAPVDSISRIIHEVQAAQTISAAHMLVFSAAADAVAKMASGVQQVARLGADNHVQMQERIRLDEVLIKALSRLAKGGRTLQWHICGAEVDLDPAMLTYLVNALLEWSACQGQNIRVWLDAETEPGHAFLKVHSDGPGGEYSTICKPCEAEWNLIAAASRAIGVHPETWSDGRSGAMLSLRFVCAGPDRSKTSPEPRATMAGSLFRSMNRKTAVLGGLDAPATGPDRKISSRPFGLRAAPGMPALPEVSEGNSQADWTLWEDSMATYYSQLPQVRQGVATRHRPVYQGGSADAFNSVTKNSA
jgi:hypothetical protein